jgi:hypothetical protein
MVERVLTYALLDHWAKRKAWAWKEDYYGRDDRAYYEYDLGDSWIDENTDDEGNKYYDAGIELRVTIGRDHEDHWEQKGYTDIYDADALIEDIYEINKQLMRTEI